MSIQLAVNAFRVPLRSMGTGLQGLLLSCVTKQLDADRLVTLRASCDAVYCNRSRLFATGGRCGSVTTITRDCVHRSAPNWVCR